MIRIVIATTFFALAAPAMAATIDFTVPLKGLDGKPATECKEPSSDGRTCLHAGAVTLGEVSGAALSIPDKGAPIEDQIKRGRLAQRVIDAKAAELTAADIALIEAQIGKLGISPVWVAQAVELLDPAAAKP